MTASKQNHTWEKHLQAHDWKDRVKPFSEGLHLCRHTLLQHPVGYKVDIIRQVIQINTHVLATLTQL